MKPGVLLALVSSLVLAGVGSRALIRKGMSASGLGPTPTPAASCNSLISYSTPGTLIYDITGSPPANTAWSLYSNKPETASSGIPAIGDAIYADGPSVTGNCQDISNNVISCPQGITTSTRFKLKGPVNDHYYEIFWGYPRSDLLIGRLYRVSLWLKNAPETISGFNTTNAFVIHVGVSTAGTTCSGGAGGNINVNLWRYCTYEFTASSGTQLIDFGANTEATPGATSFTATETSWLVAGVNLRFGDGGTGESDTCNRGL